MENLRYRKDAMQNVLTKRGTARDKQMYNAPAWQRITNAEARDWEDANGFIANIVGAPAEDATREWITITTNADEQYNLSRMITNRLEELGLQAKIAELVRFMRLYNNGGFLYFGIDSKQILNAKNFKKSIPVKINKIDFINVFDSEHVTIENLSRNPLSRNFNEQKFIINDNEIHNSRIEWMVNGYDYRRKSGRSVVSVVLDAIQAQDTALASITDMLDELSVKVWKSSQVDSASSSKILEFLQLMQTSLNTQSTVALAGDESLERLSSLQTQGLKDIFDFILEVLAGVSRVPKSRLMGQSQGVISAGQYDLVSYYDNIAKFQELKLRPVIEKTIDLILRERVSEIGKLDLDFHSLDWSFDFNSLWKLTRKEQAETELTESKADTNYFNIGVLTQSEIRTKRFEDLEEFSAFETAPNFAELPNMLVENEKNA